jgi:hypothetical protein
VLALLKLGFRYDEILDMPEQDAEEYVNAYMKLTGTKESSKTYLVKRH